MKNFEHLTLRQMKNLQSLIWREFGYRYEFQLTPTSTMLEFIDFNDKYTSESVVSIYYNQSNQQIEVDFDGDIASNEIQNKIRAIIE